MKLKFSFLILLWIHLTGCSQPVQKKVGASDSLAISIYSTEILNLEARNPGAAISLIEKGITLSRKLNYTRGEALMLNRYAGINSLYGNIVLALKHRKQSLTLYSRLKDEAAISENRTAIGLLEARLGNYQKGTALIMKALKADQARRDSVLVITDYTRLGELMTLKGEKKAALKYYNTARQLMSRRRATAKYYTLLANTAKLYSETGDHGKAIDLYKQGITASRKSGHGQYEVALLRGAARAYDSLGNKGLALIHYRLSLSKAQKLNLPEEEARSLMGLSSAVQQHDAEESIVHLKNALSIARAISNKQLASEILASLSRVYKQQSRFTEALMALEQHHELVDSLRNRNTGHRIAILQSSYALAESKLHVESLELVNDKRTAQRNFLLLAGAGTLILIMLLAFFLRRTRRLNAGLTSSNRIKDKLFSIIGHDLRNPIGGITQLLAMMESGELTPEEHSEMITEMRKQGDITLEILNALLNWGEAQLKGIHLKNIDFFPEEIIARNISVLHKQAGDKNLAVINEIPSGLKINGDPNHFDFIVRNLISNAIKFSYPSGKIEITAAEKRDGQTTFSILDHGKGISPAQLRQFDTTNIDISSGTSGEKGTGIGLMLSREFIATNYGRLWVNSEEGHGAAFNFTFGKG